MKNDPDNVPIEPHVLELNVWDVPSTILPGERFRFAVGARCSAGCNLGGRELSIFDREGSLIASRTYGPDTPSNGTTEGNHRPPSVRRAAMPEPEASAAPFAGIVKLGQEICPGTEALHFAEVEAAAPFEAGSHQWEAKIHGWDEDPPHAEGSFPLSVRVVPSPDCEVTVRAVDREKQTPIKGARVVMHPYRAVTDDNGIAKVRVARGQYDILVSGSRYLQACASVEVTDNMITNAELDADQPWTPPDEDFA